MTTQKSAYPNGLGLCFLVRIQRGAISFGKFLAYTSMKVASPQAFGARAACSAKRAAFASHFANRCQNQSGFLCSASLFILMTAAPTALIALMAPALMALMACGLRISSRVLAAAGFAFFGMLGSLVHHYKIL